MLYKFGLEAHVKGVSNRCHLFYLHTSENINKWSLHIRERKNRLVICFCICLCAFIGLCERAG